MSIKKELLDSNLPNEIQILIRRVARRTRLRSREQLDVTRELMAHFEDALEQGATQIEVIDAYGDEKTAATLLRKACKRKRWWVEVAFVQSMKYAVLGFGCFVLVYLVMVFIALQRKPTISVDYVSKMNETAAAIPENERAWPLYRAAAIALNVNSEPSPEVDGRFVNPKWVGDLGWVEYAQWIALHTETLALIRDGASKEGMGYIVGYQIAEEDKELFPEEYEESKDKPENLFIGMWFPQLGPSRDMARLLKYDAIAAAEEGDSERCFQDIEAMIHVGTQTREHSTLINDLVAMSIYNLAFQTLGTILEHTPEVLELKNVHRMLSGMDDEFDVRFEGERMFILDLLQRTFTDDGHGDGDLVPGKLIEMVKVLAQTTTPDSTVLLAPIADFFVASRKEFLDHYDGYLTLMEQYRDVQLYEWDDAVHAYETNISDAKIETYLNKYFLIDMLMPVLDRAMLIGKYTRARRDGLLATLHAMEARRSTGQWPTDLFGADVIDPWSGESWLIAIIGQQPVIYSVGCDGDNDGGTYAKDAHEWYSNPEKTNGDWVVWPNPE